MCRYAHCRYLSKWSPHQVGNSVSVTKKFIGVLLYEIIVYLITLLSLAFTCYLHLVVTRNDKLPCGLWNFHITIKTCFLPSDWGDCALRDAMLGWRLGPRTLARLPRRSAPCSSLLSLSSDTFISRGFGVLKIVRFSRHRALIYHIQYWTTSCSIYPALVDVDLFKKMLCKNRHEMGKRISCLRKHMGAFLRYCIYVSDEVSHL